jgi:hypothetical protein
MNYARLIFSSLVLLSGTVLVALGKISGETWGGLLVGLLLPGPLDQGLLSSSLKPKPLAASLGMLGLVMLSLSGCHVKGPEASFGLNPSPVQAQALAQPQASIKPLAGILTDTVALNPLASPSCPGGRACLYAKSTDSLIYTKDAAGLELKLHAGQSFRTSPNCAGLSSPLAGDVCYDTTLSAFQFFSSGWTSGAINGALYVAKGGTETITGAKTFNATTTFAGAVVASAMGPASGQQHTLPAVSSDTVALLAATQTFTNKTLTAPVLGGTITGTYTLGGTPTLGASAWASPGAIGSTTPNTGAFTSVSIAGAPVDAVFQRVCTLTSAAAATPVVCLTDAEVPSGKKAYVSAFTAKVNGATPWTTITSCFIEDTSGNAFVTVPVASLTSNAYVGPWSGALTLDNRLTLSTGGTTAKGLQIRCDVNGTGSDLVVTLVGVTK